MNVDFQHKEFPKRFARNDFWSQIKRTVHGHPVKESDIQQIVQQIIRCLDLTSNDHLLDLGCGNAALASRFTADLTAYTGVDFSGYLLGVAEEYFSASHTRFIQSDIRRTDQYLPKNPQFSKVLLYGVASYLSQQDAIILLDSLLSQLPHLQKIFIGNLPHRDHAEEFFANRKVENFELDNPHTPIGVWWTPDDWHAAGSKLGVDVECRRMPETFYGHAYRFDVILKKRIAMSMPYESAIQRIDSPHPTIKRPENRTNKSLQQPTPVHVKGQRDRPLSTSNLHAPNMELVCDLYARHADNQAIITELESALCRYHDSQYCVTFGSGFWALVASVSACALPGRREVIIPSMTYRRLADVVFWSGKTPVMVDVSPNSLAICPFAVAEAINDQTALILGVHPIVNCCDVDALLAISNRNEIPIVFDAVESVHETIGGKRIGSFGPAEVFSLHASKLLNGLEGGYVCTNREDLSQWLRRFRDGILHTSIGPQNLSHALPAAHAAFALASLNEIDDIVNHNRNIYQTYQVELNSVPGIRLVEFDESEQTSYKNIVVEIENRYPLSRDQLTSFLNQNGILARAHYSPALHQREYKFPTQSRTMLVSDHAAASYLNLPCGSRITPNQVRMVCELLRAPETLEGNVGRFQTDENTSAMAIRLHPDTPPEQQVIQAIYRNQYFTNHGPLTKQLEDHLAQETGMPHIVAVGHFSLALLITLAALENTGTVLTDATLQQVAESATRLLGLSLETFPPPVELDLPRTASDLCCILATEASLSSASETQVYQSASPAPWVLISDLKSTNLKNEGLPDSLIRIIPLDPENSTQAAAIATSSLTFADRCRNIRSSYGAPRKTPVIATCNGRISEFQAGMAVLSLLQRND